MKKFKIFKSGFCEKLKLLLIPIGLLIGSFTMRAWAGTWYSNDMWNVWGWKTGYDNDGWLKEGLDSGEDYDLGVIASEEYYIKGLGAFTNGGDVTFVRCYFTYPDATNSNAYLNEYTSQWGGGDNPERYWEKKSIWTYHISSTTHSVGDHAIQIYFKLGYSDNSEQSENHRQIKWTIPGFATSSTSKDFGSNNPINKESVTKIDVAHYGDWPTLGGCVLSGKNASEFEVIDIDYTGVTVVFKPTSAGAKSATLTITDTYSKTCTISLTGTGAANTATTRLYFNNYNYNSDWITDGALPRFTCEYTTGIYTRYPMTKCENSTYNWYADVEIKGATVNVDRYNPSSPYNTWNTVSMSGLNASNPYAVLDNYSGGTYYGFATNHPYNDVSGGNIYYDNSKSGLTNTLYLIIGHDYKMSNGGVADEYSKGHALANIGNTKLYYLALSDTWHDADYYAFIGASSAPSAGTWGSDDLSSKASSSSYTDIYRDIMDLASGSSYLGFAATKTGGALSLTKSPTLNTTQTFNYALSTDGGTNYPALTSGPNTPGQLSMSAYEFTNAQCTTVVAKSSLTPLSANATTYSKAVSNVAYTGTTVLTESNTRDGYSFMGWYEGNTQLTNANTHSYTYYPRSNQTLTARYKAHRYTIAFSNNDAQYSSAPAATGSTTGISNVVYDQNVTLTANGFEREGYTFAGWNREADGSGASYTDEQSVSNLTATDGATVTLYAQWTEILHDVTVEYKYGETRVQVDGEVEDVGIVTTKDATAPATIGGYSFTEWSTLPSAVTTSDELTSRTITIKATADGQTITANYEPSTYVGEIEGVDGGDGAYSVVYHATSLTATTVPERTGYDIGGYYLDYDAEAETKYYNQIAKANGNLMKNISTYTDSDGKWIKTSAPATIYASWTNKTYTITLAKNTPTGTTGTAGDANFTAKYNTNTFSTISNYPTAVGYTFAGYYDDPDDGEGVLVIKDATQSYGKNTGTIYIDGSGNWISSDEDLTLYAHWTANEYTITLNDRNATSAVSPGSVTATFASNSLESITPPDKWGSTFGGWETSGGILVIDEDGDFVESVTNYTDASGNWKRDGGVTLYARWTPKDHLYWIPGNTSSQVGNVSGAVEFISAGGGKYYVTIDTDNNQVFHLGDGTNAAGPASPTNTDHTEFTLATSACGLSTNSYWFKQTGSKQTIVYVLDINDVTLDFENLVIYKPGDKSGDGHTAYGSVEGFSGTIYGTFEYRMRVDEIGKWNTLYLPFTTTNVQVWDGAYYSIYPCHRSGGTLMQGYYVIRTPESATNFPIKDFGKWNDPTDYIAWVPAANTPYIIQWQMDYFHNKYITFWGNGATIASSVSFVPGDAPSADDVVNVLGNGTLGTVEVTAAYVLANDYGSGAWLRDEDVKKKSAVGPFECYIRANPETTGKTLVIKRRTGEETPTGWEDVLNSENKAQIVVYTITGLRVTEYNDCSFNEAGRRLSETYNEGIFIMRAGDESVKLMLR